MTKFLDKGQPDPSGDKYARKIGSIALDPYTKEGYPRTVAKYGTRLDEVETFRRQAAEMSIDSGKCDFVEMVELSDKKSTLQHLEFWVDCRNGQRIYLDENQLTSGANVRTEADKAWSESTATAACKQGIKDRALLPSEVTFHEILGTTFVEAPRTHNVVVTMDFEAINAFGTELKYTAKCHFAPGELGTIDIYLRE